MFNQKSHTRSMLARWIWCLIVTMGYTSSVSAQAPMRQRAPSTLGPVTPSGVVVALNTNSITVKSRTGETIIRLDEKPVITSLKPIQLVDLKTPKWATVYREPPRGETNVITVAWLKVAPQAPERAAMEKEIPGKPQPPMAMRVNLSGSIKVDGQSGSLQTDGQTFNLKFTERTRVYKASPATLNDVKIGANVMLDLGVVGGQFVAKGIDLLSPDEPGSRDTR